MTTDKPFAFAYFPLSTDDTIRVSGNHSLPLYEYHHKTASLAQLYLDPMSADLKPLQDFSFTIRSFLVSSEVAEESTLCELFDWERTLMTTGGKAALQETLTKLKYVDELQIARFLG